jgi:hypothetical protein
VVLPLAKIKFEAEQAMAADDGVAAAQWLVKQIEADDPDLWRPWVRP